jgi:hypothetical protein
MVKNLSIVTHLSSGFIRTGDRSAPDTQCVVCNKVLHNCSIFPTKLCRHLENTHPECTAKNISFFFFHAEA